MESPNKSHAGTRLATASKRCREPLAFPRADVSLDGMTTAAMNTPLATVADADIEGHRGGGGPIGQTAAR